MLSIFFFKILKPLLSLGSFVVFFLVFFFVCANFYFSLSNKKRKIPLPVILIAGLNISVGVVSLIIMFVSKGTDSFAYDFLIRAGIFLFAAANVLIGIILVKLKTYAKLLTLCLFVVFAILDIILTLTTEHSKHVFGLIGFYAVIFTMYYFGLNDKYFKKNDDGFSMREDAAKKKEYSTLTDFFKE